MQDGQDAPQTPRPAPAARPPLSFGEKAVGLTFNPSKDPNVELIKRHCALVIDDLNNLREQVQDGEAKAMYTLAIRSIQVGQMWGVKAATWTIDK